MAPVFCYTFSMNIHEKFKLLETEIQIVSKLAKDYFDSEDFSNESKEDGSVVTKIDKEIEKVLREFVGTHFPDDAIVGEEEDNKDGTSGFVWHIDPIDGTSNFLRKIPFCAVSVARLGDTMEDSFAIVHNPITNHTFASLMDNGVFENEKISTCTAEPLGGTYLMSTGIIPREEWMRSAKVNIQQALAKEFGKHSTHGCTALQLAYVAAGRIDGYFTMGLSTYDYAAGLYLARAAGGAISIFENGIWRLAEESLKDICNEHEKIIFVSHPNIHQRAVTLIGDPKKWSD